MTVIYGTVEATGTWFRPGAQTPGETAEAGFYPFPLPGSVQATYLNKCVDGVTNQWVFWETFFQDRNGTQYPGQSFDSATYKVETIVHQREQV